MRRVINRVSNYSGLRSIPSLCIHALRCRNYMGYGSISLSGVVVMLTQYYEAGTISSTFLDVFYSKIGALDRYVITQTADGQYGCLVYRIPQKECVMYTITRTGSNYGNYYYQFTETPSTWEYDIDNEIYCYSNVGIGRMDVLPCHEIMVCWGVAIMTCALALAIVFKGVLFKCLRKNRPL